jgi:hypothetical protein
VVAGCAKWAPEADGTGGIPTGQGGADAEGGAGGAGADGEGGAGADGEGGAGADGQGGAGQHKDAAARVGGRRQVWSGRRRVMGV